MSTLKWESGQRVGAAGAVQLIDCGPASKRTKGFYVLILFELGIPPFNYLYPL
jgi:hypothetical protein